jgi:hypothetical protein
MPALLHSAVFVLALIATGLAVLHIMKQPNFPLWPSVLLICVAVMVAAIPA